MLSLNTKLSIKFYEIYGKSICLFPEWAQKTAEKMLKYHYTNSDDKLDNNLTAFYFEPRNKKGKEYRVYRVEANDILTFLLTAKA